MNVNRNPILIGTRWVFPDGATIPLVAGGSGDFLGAPPAGITLEGDPGQHQSQTQPRDDQGRFTAEQEAEIAAAAAANSPTTTDTNPQTGRTFTEDEVAKIRREEKDKLYKEIGTLREQMTVLTAAEEERQRQLAAAQAEADRAAEEARLQELSAIERIAELENRFTSETDRMRAEMEAERATFAKERAFQELQQYRTQRLAEEAETIMPDLIDFVSGGTAEEIEASISRVKERTQAILANMQAAQQQAVPPALTPPVQGSHITAPPVGPMDNQTSHQQLSAADIAAMDMNEYAANRDRLMQGASQQRRNGGLYG